MGRGAEKDGEDIPQFYGVRIPYPTLGGGRAERVSVASRQRWHASDNVEG